MSTFLPTIPLQADMLDEGEGRALRDLGFGAFLGHRCGAATMPVGTSSLDIIFDLEALPIR